MNPRIRQSAWCCGRNYLRWAVGRVHLSACKSPRATARTRCEVCGNPLEYRIIENASLDRYYRHREKNYLAGLTVLGTPYRRRQNFIHQTMPPTRKIEALKTRKEHIRVRVRLNARKRIARLAVAGLTSRGTKPKINRGSTPLEKDWRELRAAIPPVLHVEDVVTGQREIYA